MLHLLAAIAFRMEHASQSRGKPKGRNSTECAKWKAKDWSGRHIPDDGPKRPYTLLVLVVLAYQISNRASSTDLRSSEQHLESCSASKSAREDR